MTSRLVLPQANVAVAPERQDVGRCASGRTANDEEAEGEGGVEPESDGRDKAKERHHDELRRDADKEAGGMEELIQNEEIINFEFLYI